MSHIGISSQSNDAFEISDNENLYHDSYLPLDNGIGSVLDFSSTTIVEDSTPPLVFTQQTEKPKV